MRTHPRTLIAAIVALVAARAHGQEAPPVPHTARLEYAGGPATAHCPGDAALRAAVVTRLGYDPFVDSDTLVRASIVPHGRGLRGRIEVHRPGAHHQGVRQIDTRRADCTEIARAMALAISVAIDPLARRAVDLPVVTPEPPSPSPAPPSSSAPPAETPSASPSPAPPSSSPPPPAVVSMAARARLRLGFGLDGLYGLQPDVTFGGHLHLGVRWPRFSLGLDLRGAIPTTRQDGPGTVSITAVTATALGCLHEVPVRYLALCALVSGSMLVGNGTGFPTSLPPSVLGPVMGLGGRIGVEIPLGSVFALTAHLEAEWLLTTASFVVTPTLAQVWGTTGIAAGVGIGTVAHFR